MPKLKVVNRSRFIFSLIIILLVLYLLGSVFLNTFIAEGIEEQELIEIHVKSGDTLWGLAEKFGSKDQDIRKLVFEISTVNQLSTSEIYPGQIIKIPIVK